MESSPVVKIGIFVSHLQMFFQLRLPFRARTAMFDHTGNRGLLGSDDIPMDGVLLKLHLINPLMWLIHIIYKHVDI